LFGWKEHGLAFDVALHFGTVIALVYIFWKDWLLIIRRAFQKEEANNPYPKNLLWQILVASLPAAIIGILIDRYVEKYFHHPLLLALNLVLFGIALWYADQKFNKDLEIRGITYKKSFLVGITQSIALIPGVSRSGITMAAARAVGLDRENAARFSFLIGMPAMIGAFLFKLKDLGKDDLNIPFLVGILASAVFGLLAIKFLLNYLKKSDFSVFLWYRIALAAIIIIFLFL
jgi:undecaprenyl-diphosphatase